MKLPINIAKQLMLMQQGNKIPAAQMKHATVLKLLDDNVLQKQRIGSNRNLYFINDFSILKQYLHNHFGIENLGLYIDKYEQENLTRAEAVEISSDSKLKSIRTFKGFLVNCYEPINAILNNEQIVVHPTKGTFTFIHDFENFIPATNITIVGTENPENFRWIEKQQHLFAGLQVLFISRYPQTQNADVIKWLKNISNQYIHFGDFDFEGINIYLREYKKHLQERASFFVPAEIETLLQTKGNRDLYNRQFHHQPAKENIDELAIIELLQFFHQSKKCLEQEALIQ